LAIAISFGNASEFLHVKNTDDHSLSNCAKLHTENLLGLYQAQYEEFRPVPRGNTE